MRATRTYLEMRNPSALRPAAAPEGRLRLERLTNCPAELYRSLYRGIGQAFHWTDRAGWSDEDIGRHVARPEVALWLLSVDEAMAGYFELQAHGDGSTEVAYFGLFPDFIGRGLGGWLLTEAVRAAWSTGPTRVWLHTSTLDHPAALPNYLARGFEIVRTEEYAVRP